MKAGAIAWLGTGQLEKTHGWQTKSIAELADHSLGKMLDKAKNRGEPQPYLRNLNVRWFAFDLSDLQEMLFQQGEEDRYSVRKGDLVICEGGYPGRAAIWDSDEPIYFQKALHRVRFHEPAHAKWCLYYLLGEDLADRLRSNFNGTGIQHFTGEALARFRVPVPPLGEIQRIVALLDEAFEGIATAKDNAEKSQRSAQELFDNFMRMQFSARGLEGAGRTLEDVCEISSKLVDPRGADYFDLLHIGAGNIESKSGLVKEVKTAREEQLISGKFLFDESTVLYSKIRPYLMKVVRPSFKGICSADIYPLVPKSDGIARDYLYHLLLSPAFTEYAIKGSARVGMPKVNRDHLFAYRSWMPSMEEQVQIARRLDALAQEVEAFTSICLAKLSALDELKKSLLHQAFTGQLTAAKSTKATNPLALLTTSPEFTANVICLAYERHKQKLREKTFGHVKAQKVLHLVESIAKVDLGRQPIRDAAGPNDFRHMLNAEDWARANGVFEMVNRGGGYEFRKLSTFDQHQPRARQALEPYLSQLERVIDLLVPMDTEQAEVFATIHAAWNNLIADGAAVTDDAIVSAAREDWHPDKLKIAEHKFRTAIALIRQKGLVPDGTAKYVGGQQRLI